MQPTFDVQDAYRSHGHVVLRRARQILGHDEDAQEVLQELFTSLLDRPEQFGRRSSVTTFLYNATTHMCLNRIRNQRNRLRLVDQRVAPTMASGEGPRAEAAVDAASFLARLPDELAQVAVYYFIDELTREEIARVMDCSRRKVGYLIDQVQTWAQQEEGRA